MIHKFGENLLKYSVVFFIIAFSQINAQNTRDTVTFHQSYFKQNYIFSNFEKQLNTYNLISHLKYGYKISGLFTGYAQDFVSTVTKSSVNNIKDEMYIKFLADYEFNENLSTGFLFAKSNYADDRRLAINKSDNTNASVYLRYKPTEKISVIPFGGYAINNQIGNEDKGFTYGAEADINTLPLSDFFLSGKFRYVNEDISPRKNTGENYGINIKNDFDNNLTNFLSANYLLNRKDFYIEADSVLSEKYNIENNIQSRVETNNFIYDRIEFSTADKNILFDVSGRLNWRLIDRSTKYVDIDNITNSSFDTKIEEFKIDFASSLNFSLGIFSGFFKLLYSEREEKHNAKMIPGAGNVIYQRRQELEVQKNNQSQQTTAALSGSLALSRKDNFSFSLFHRKLKYDTPSPENFDDRDELLTMAQLTYLRQINSFLSVFANIEGSFNQIVYIFAERSSNNNIRRALKFSAGSELNSSIVRSYNEAEVSANYTVYDYEDINPNFKSFSFRQLSLKDSTVLQFTKKVAFKFNGYIKISEQGEFFWSRFSNRPIRYLEEKNFEPKLELRLGILKLAAGVRYFSLMTFGYKSSQLKKLDSEYQSIGPLSEIIISNFGSLQVKCIGWYEFISNEKKQKRELANLFMQVNWSL